MNWIEFIKEYKEVIATGLSFIIILIVGLIRNKTKLGNYIDSILKDVYEILPGLISKVEVPGSGSTKKNMVLVLVQQYLYKKYKFLDFEKIEQQVSNMIEDVLKTPQKKEDK